MVSQLLQFLNLLSFRPNQSDYTFSSITIQKKKEIKHLPRTQLVKICAEIDHTVDSKYSALLDIYVQLAEKLCIGLQTLIGWSVTSTELQS